MMAMITDYDAPSTSLKASTSVDDNESKILDLKINFKKILNLSEENFQTFNDEIQILHLDFEKFEKVWKLLDFDKFPNLFLIVIETENVTKVCDEILAKKFSKCQKAFVQIFSKHDEVSKFYEKRESEETFNEIDETFSNSNLKASKKFSKTKSFFQLLNQLKISFVDMKLHQLLKFLNVKDKKVSTLKNVFKQEEKDLQSIFLLFCGEEAQENPKDKSSKFENFQNLSNLKGILLTIAQQNDLEKLKILLECPHNFLELSTFSEMRKISHDNNFFEFSFELQTIESEFYPENFHEILQNFHSNIESGNFLKVREFVENFSDFKFCCDENQISALEKSIAVKNFEIYSFLLSESFMSFNEIQLSNLSNEEKEEIRKFNEKFSKKNPENFVNILCTKCDLFSCSGVISYSEIREMIIKLSKIPELRPFLEFAAETSVKIIFDFKTESVKLMDPNHSEFTMGLSYFSENLLFVGRDRSESQKSGTFIHELTHFVLYKLYGNKCLPYCFGDTVREDSWTKIVAKIKNKFNENPEEIEEIIRWVFQCYQVGYEQNAELAVRVNHVLARYSDDPEKVQQICETFKELFDYQNFILKDLKISNVFRLIEMNSKYGILEKLRNSKLQLLPMKSVKVIDKSEKKIIIHSNVPTLTLQKISKEILNTSENKFDLMTKNIFVDFEKLKQENLKVELKSLSESVERIFVKVEEFDEENLKFLMSLNVQTFFISRDESLLKVLKLSKHEILHNWSEITMRSKREVLSKSLTIRDQGYQLSDFLKVTDKISKEIFTILCNSESFEMNFEDKAETLENFIPRKVEVKRKIEFFDERGIKRTFFKFEEISLESFLEKFKDDKILLISDSAGAGKSSILHKVHEILTESSEVDLVLFVGLKDHLEELSKGVGENFLDFICKIFKLNQLEVEILTQKFQKGEVKILFDAFDEISPKCKEETLKLFKLFDKVQGQIFITTRTHLEHELESELEVLAHRLKPLDELEQVKFLINFWKSSDEIFIKKCAESLVKKISKIISVSPSLIGVPLIIKDLAKIFLNKISSNFHHEIEKLKISSVYMKIFDESFNILNERFKENLEENSKKSSSLLKVYQTLAVVHYFDEDFANELGLNFDDEEWTLEEIARAGIIKYGKDKKVQFNHETYAENLLALVMFQILKNSKNFTKVQSEMFLKIIKLEKFQITRMFLDDMLESFEGFKIFNSREKVCKILESESYQLLNFIADEGLVTFLKFILEFTKNNSNFYQNLIESPVDNFQRTTLMKILPKIRDEEKFSNFLDEIFDFYGDEVFEKFLTRIDQQSETIFFQILSNSSKVVEIFLKKVEEKNFGDKKFQKIFFAQSSEGKTFLHLLTTFKNFEKTQKVFEFLQNNLNIESQKKLLINMREKDYGESIFLSFPFHDVESSKFIFEYVQKLFKVEEFREILKITNDYRNNILNLAARFSQTKESFEFIWEKISEIFESSKVDESLENSNALNLIVLNLSKTPKEFFMRKGFADRNLLQLSAYNLNDSRTFEFAFNLARNLCSPDELKNFILEKNYGNENLLVLMANFLPDVKLKFLFNELPKVFDQNEIKEILKTTKGNLGRNLLQEASKNENINSIEILWNFHEENLTCDEILELIYEKEKFGENLLHFAASHAKSKESFELIWKKIEKNFKNDEEIKEFLKNKGDYGRSALITSIVKKNDKIFLFLFEEIYRKFFTFEEILKDRDGNGKNFVEYLNFKGSSEIEKFKREIVGDENTKFRGNSCNFVQKLEA